MMKFLAGFWEEVGKRTSLCWEEVGKRIIAGACQYMLARMVTIVVSEFHHDEMKNAR
jgi:hypothetical protein